MAIAMIAAAMTVTNDLRIETTSCSNQSDSLSTPLPADHRPGIHNAWRVLVIRSIGRVELNVARPNGPRLRKDVRIIHGVLVGERVAVAAEFFDHTHFGRVEPAGRRCHIREPGLVVEADRLDHERVALPMAD